MIAILLSIMVLASFALLAGAVLVVRKQGWGLKPLLMLLLVLILLGNAALLSVPNKRGLAPVDAQLQR